MNLRATSAGALLAAAIAASGMAAALLLRRSTAESPVPDVPGLMHLSAGLRDGDLVLRMGRGLWSAAFRDLSPHDRRFSHVGIALGDETRGFEVIHADADDLTGVGRVRAEPLESFLGEADAWAVYRHARVTPQRVAGCLARYLGRPFDARFDLGDDRAVYCTELVYLCYNELDQPGSVATRVRDGRVIVTIEDCYADGTVWMVVASGESSRR